MNNKGPTINTKDTGTWVMVRYEGNGQCKALQNEPKDLWNYLDKRIEDLAKSNEPDAETRRSELLLLNAWMRSKQS